MENTTPETAHNEETSILPKMTMKAIGVAPNLVTAVADGQRLLLARVYGRCEQVKYKEENDGRISACLIGSFKAVNAQDGVAAHGHTFKSGKLYLPGGFHEMVESAINQAKKADDLATVDFGFEIYSTKANNPAGYSYQAKPLMGATVADPLADVERAINEYKSERQKQLESQKQESAKQIEAPATQERKAAKK